MTCVILFVICMIGTLEVNDSESRINAHLMVGSTSCSLAKEFKYLSEDKEKINIVKECVKYKKREGNRKIRKRAYHLQDKGDIEMMGTKKEGVGFKKCIRNGISFIHSIIRPMHWCW